MAMPTSMIGGLISGMDTASIIDQLMQIERRPVDRMEMRLEEERLKLEAYRGINSVLLDFSSTTGSIAGSELWDTKSTSSSNESVLTATASKYARAGTYSFRVGRLAQRAEFVSSGFADRDDSPVSASGGTVTIDSALGGLSRKTSLSALNGGGGVYHGSIKITDRQGDTATIDLSTAATLQDVIDTVNAADGVDVTLVVDDSAAGGGARLTITDNSGGAGTFKVENAGSSTTATDLGIEKSGLADTLAGDDINAFVSTTPLALLNNGMGVNDGNAGTIVIEHNGVTTEVDLSAARTLQDVVDAITDAHGDLNASLVGGENLNVWSTATGTVRIYSDTGDDPLNSTAEDLGIGGFAFDGAGNPTITGRKLTSPLNSVRADQISGQRRFDRDISLDDFGIADGDTLTVTDKEGDSVTFTAGTGAGRDGTTVGDLLDKINGSTDDVDALMYIDVDKGGLVIADLTGKTDPGDTMTITGTARTALGFSTDTAAGSVNAVQGDAIYGGGMRSAFLSDLGVNVGDVLDITDRNGNNFTYAAAAGDRVQALVNAITNDTNTDLVAHVDEANGRLVIEDTSGGPANLIIADVMGATLGLNGSFASDYQAGASVYAGGGLREAESSPAANLGSVFVDDGLGGLYELDLSAFDGSASIRDIVNELNTQAANAALVGGGPAKNLEMVFAINADGNGITVTNNAAGETREFTVNPANFSHKLGYDLGLITGSALAAAGGSVDTGDLDAQYITRSTKLADLNGGEGVESGYIAITSSKGLESTVSLSGATTVGDVIAAINNAGPGLRASINETGDGIMLVDRVAGNLAIEVSEAFGGSTAADLGLLGAGDKGMLDGSYEASVTIDGNDTLVDVMNKIAESGAAVNTSIINDGSGFTPYRLTVSGNSTGALADLMLTTDIAALGLSKSADGVDSVLLMGQSGVSSPTMLTGKSNTNSSAVLGLTLDMKQASGSFTTVSVTEDTSGVVSAAEELVQKYNALNDIVKELTSYDEESQTPALLFGDIEMRNLMSSINDSFFFTVEGIAGGYTSWYDIGLSFTREGKMELNTSELQDALSYNFESVKELLTRTVDAARGDRGASVSTNASADRVKEPDVNSWLANMSAPPPTTNVGDRYRITSSAAPDAAWGTIANLADNVVVEYDGSEWFVNDQDYDYVVLATVLDAGVTPPPTANAGDRYILRSGTSNLDPGWGAIADVKDDVIVEFDGADWMVDTDDPKYDITNIVNGNTDPDDYGTGNGFTARDTIASGDDTVTIGFDKARYISRVNIHHLLGLGDDDNGALKDFTVEYLDGRGDWQNLRTITGNKSDVNYLGLAAPTLMSQLRITATGTNADDGKMRLLEIEAMEDNNLGGQLEREIDSITDSIDGFFARLEEEQSDRIKRMQESIADRESRLESVEMRYIRQYAAMESAMASLTTQSDFFTQQMSAWTNGAKK